MRSMIPSVLQKVMLAAACLSFAIYGFELSASPDMDSVSGECSDATLCEFHLNASGVGLAQRSQIEKSYGNIPLSFVANNGQFDESVKFVAKGAGYSLFLTPTEAFLSFVHSYPEQAAMPGTVPNQNVANLTAGGVVRLKLIGSDPNAQFEEFDELKVKSNYFIGNDPERWRKGVSNYAKVKIENVYPGIDLIYYGNQRQLEYDWIVNPNADPKVIKFAVEGRGQATIDADGNLILDEKSGLRLNRPFIYQQRAGSRTEVAGSYILLSEDTAGFELGEYDSSLPLVIDPVLNYSTYIGGSGYDHTVDIAVDSSGNTYVTGDTTSSNFPTANAFQAIYAGHQEIFVTKLSASGNELVYSTYVGGSSDEGGVGIDVDASGNAYVTGYTTSADFPAVNPLQAGYAGGYDAFAIKLNASGTGLMYSTYLGGSSDDNGVGIAVDASGNAYITGYTTSSNFPTANALQANYAGTYDAFIAKLNASGTGLLYSTYLGGSKAEYGTAIALDASGNAYLTGRTYSSDFPTANALQAQNAGEIDAFITKVNAMGSDLLYSTYLGGSLDEYATGIAVDVSGNAYLTGYTTSSNFPTANPLQAQNAGAFDAFVTKINPVGTGLVYSTYLGGSSTDKGDGIAVDSSGNAYVTGSTYSTNFPTANPLQANFAGGTDAFVAKLNPMGSVLYYSTYVGGSGVEDGAGIALDASGNTYVTGTTYSTNFPTSNPFQANFAGGSDVFIAKIGLPLYSGITLGDVDGDGRADIGVWRPSNGIWYILNSGSPNSYSTANWGVGSDIPVPGDFDGDGKTDLAVWRPGTGNWYIRSSNEPGTYSSTRWGSRGDIPVPLDYDGDGRMDIAVWRPSNGSFYVLPSKSPGAYTITRWGMVGDLPVLGGKYINIRLR